MAIDSATLEHLARLARLSLDDVERARMSEDLARTLNMVDALQRIEVTGIEPLASPHLEQAPRRADEVTEADTSAALLALSADAQGGFFLVPKVIE